MARFVRGHFMPERRVKRNSENLAFVTGNGFGLIWHAGVSHGNTLEFQIIWSFDALILWLAILAQYIAILMIICALNSGQVNYSWWTGSHDRHEVHFVRHYNVRRFSISLRGQLPARTHSLCDDEMFVTVHACLLLKKTHPCWCGNLLRDKQQLVWCYNSFFQIRIGVDATVGSFTDLLALNFFPWHNELRLWHIYFATIEAGCAEHPIK